MLAVRRLALLLGTCLALAINLWPALWNNFPLVYDDDSVYLAFPETIRAAMPQFYSMGLWGIVQLVPLPGVVLIQSLLTTYVLYAAFATFTRLPAAVCLLGATILSGLTQLPWLVSWLTPDFLGGLGILAVITLAFRQRRNAHDLLLLVVAAMACLVSTANIFVILPMSLGLAIARPWLTGLPVDRITAAGLILLFVLGLMPQLRFNMLVENRPVLAVGSSARLFSKLVDHSLAQPYLSDICAKGDRAACFVASEIGHFAAREDFLWGAEEKPALADRLDAWHDPTGIFDRWSKGILLRAPAPALAAALDDAALLSTKWVLSPGGREIVAHAAEDDSVRFRIETHHEAHLDAFLKARQQTGELQAEFPAAFYMLTTLCGYVGLLAGLLFAVRKRDRDLTALCGALLMAIIWSMIVHGGLSLPIARYSVKTSWLALFGAMIWLVRRARPERGTGPPQYL